MDKNQLKLEAYKEAKGNLTERYDVECRTYMWPESMPMYPTDEEIEEEAMRIYAFLIKEKPE